MKRVSSDGLVQDHLRNNAIIIVAIAVCINGNGTRGLRVGNVKDDGGVRGE